MRNITSSWYDSVKVIENLPKYLKASYMREGSVAKEYALNRCLNHIERISKVRNLENKEGLLKRLWGIYFQLQDFEADERQDFNVHRELPLMVDHEEIEGDTVVEGVAVDTDSPNIYSGGLGYRHVNWDSAFLMAMPKGSVRKDTFWNEEEAKKVRPVKHYSKEEIAELNRQNR